MTAKISFARYSTCKEFGIKAVPWEWGERWVHAHNKSWGETVAKIVSAAPGNMLEIYQRISQPHPFSNLLFATAKFPSHILIDKLGVADIGKCNKKFHHVIGWDSAIIFMEKEERWDFWREIERCMSPSGRITVAWNHFFHVNQEAVTFMNSGIFRRLNHHFRENLSPFDFKGGERIWRAVRESSVCQAFNNLADGDSLPDTDVMAIPYLEVISQDCFPDPDKAKKVFRDVGIGAVGVDMVLEAS